MRRRTALLTLLLLIGLIAVPLVLTWREVRQEQLNHALIAAVDRNDTAGVQRLLRQGADANAQVRADDKRPWWRRIGDMLRHGSASASLPEETVLAKAIEWWPPLNRSTFEKRDNVDTVKALLDAGAEANHRFVRFHPDGSSDEQVTTAPIVVAARKWKWKVVQTLLAHQANVNATDSYGNTTLMFAAHEWNADMIKLLLKQRADPNAKDDGGETALLWLFDYNEALRHDRVGGYSHMCSRNDPRIRACAIPLLQSGASTHIKNREGQTLMSVAQSWDFPQLIQKLKQADAKDEGDRR